MTHEQLQSAIKRERRAYLKMLQDLHDNTASEIKGALSMEDEPNTNAIRVSAINAVECGQRLKALLQLMGDQNE